LHLNLNRKIEHFLDSKKSKNALYWAKIGIGVYNWRSLGSGLVDQSQKITVAARAMAERKAIEHLS